MAVACLLVVGGGLVFLQLYRGAGQQRTIVILRHDVSAGALVTSADIEEIDLHTGTHLDVVTAEEFVRMPQRIAQMHLTAGAPLQPRHIGTHMPVSSGQAIAAISLPSQAIPLGLRSTSLVRVLVGDTAFDGEVVDVKRPDQSSTAVGVSIRLATSAARLVAVSKDVRLIVVGPDEPPTIAVRVSGPVAP